MSVLNACLLACACQVGDVIRQLHTAVRGTVMEDFIPQVIIPIPSLPRNADGTVDKFKLKSTQRSARLSWRMSVGFANYRAPQTPVQEAVVALMRQVFVLFCCALAAAAATTTTSTTTTQSMQLLQQRQTPTPTPTRKHVSLGAVL